MVILACATTIMMNWSNEAFNDRDMEEYKVSKKHCSEIYKDAPCVRKFIKKDRLIYWVICTGENSK